MNEYIKIKCTLKDRIIFLLTSLIDKKFILVNDIPNNINISKDTRKVKNEIKDRISMIDDIPDEFDIPFFELDNKNVESNLK